jgi:predicted glycosyltransferase involved in capsule biosynthesis
MSINNVSYIIGHRGNQSHRLANLLCVIRSVQRLGCEIIVVEQDSNPFCKTHIENLGAKYIFAENNGMYNRSWAFNIGFKNTQKEQKEIIFLADNDILLNIETIKDIANNFEGKDTINPYSNVIDCNPQKTDLLRKSNNNQDFSGVARGRGGCNYAGGILVFSRNAFERVGGWDENFEGWGAEDNHMLLKIDKLGLKKENIVGNCLHLYHDRTPSARAFHKKYDNNLRQIGILNKMSKDECISFCEKQYPIIGNVDRYKKG